MPRARWLWLLVPIAGLAELGLFVVDAERAPRIAEWQAVRAAVAKLKQPADLLVVAPEWADPIARYAFGDALMPISDEARPDVSSYARAVEVDALGNSSAELDGWAVREERAARPLQAARARESKAGESPVFVFGQRASAVPHRDGGRLPETAERPCVYTQHAQVEHGRPTRALGVPARTLHVRRRGVLRRRHDLGRRRIPTAALPVGRAPL